MRQCCKSKATQRLLRAFLDLYLQGYPHQASHKGRCWVLRNSLHVTNHFPKITKPCSCPTVSKGVRKGLNRGSHPAIISLATILKQYCHKWASNPNRKVFLSHHGKGFSRHCNWINSWGAKLLFIVGPVSTSISTPKTLMNLVQNGQGWVKSLNEANS